MNGERKTVPYRNLGGVSIYIELDLRSELAALADAQGRSLSNYVARVLADHVAATKEQ